MDVTDGCAQCTHPRADHSGPQGWCRYGYEPFAAQQSEQCLCSKFQERRDDGSKS